MRNRISKNWRVNRRFILLFFIIIPSFFISTSLIFYAFGVRINVSASFPLGFYLLEEGEPDRGDLVFIRPPENDVIQWGRETGVILRSIMLKRLYGIAGDEVSVDGDGIRINGILICNSRIIDKNPDGSSIPSIAQSGVIPLDSVWVMSEYSELSFDSRYFGAVPSRNIQSKAKPLWVW